MPECNLIKYDVCAIAVAFPDQRPEFNDFMILEIKYDVAYCIDLSFLMKKGKALINSWHVSKLNKFKHPEQIKEKYKSEIAYIIKLNPKIEITKE